MYELVNAAVEARGRIELGPRQSRQLAQIQGPSDAGSMSGFALAFQDSIFGAPSGQVVVSFTATSADPTNQGLPRDRIEAQSRIGDEASPTRVVWLACDCRTGEPCLVDEDRCLVDAEEFVREVLLPILFPELKSVDQPPGRHIDEST